MSEVVAGILFTCLGISISLETLSIVRPDLRTWPPPSTTPWPRPLLRFVDRLFPTGLIGLLLLSGIVWRETRSYFARHADGP